MHCRLFSFFFHYFFKYLQYVTVADFIGYKVITIAGKALKDLKLILLHQCFAIGWQVRRVS